MVSPPLRKTTQAEEDLIDLWSYIARENPAAADRLLDRLEGRWELLKSQPYMGAEREDIAPGIRHVVVGSYLTLYRVAEGQVEIVRVLYGERHITADDIPA
jgi:toxin ParE1/3/4